MSRSLKKGPYVNPKLMRKIDRLNETKGRQVAKNRGPKNNDLALLHLFTPSTLGTLFLPSHKTIHFARNELPSDYHTLRNRSNIKRLSPFRYSIGGLICPPP